MAGMPLRFLLAHGAGASSSSGWMRRYAEHLGALGSVSCFDYPYMRAGGRKAPDKLDVLVAAHRDELAALQAASTAGDKLILAGKSMGSRVGCHVTLDPDSAVTRFYSGLVYEGITP